MSAKFTQFDYLLNAFEQASQSDKPADNGYGTKRRALFAHVRELEARAAVADRIGATPERHPDPGQQWKVGDEYLPFHPSASHVPPDYRDGWNRCFWMTVARAADAPPSVSASHGSTANESAENVNSLRTERAGNQRQS